jgi:WD40 repeat protein/uncharacterized caspase-like protein
MKMPLIISTDLIHLNKKLLATVSFLLLLFISVHAQPPATIQQPKLMLPIGHTDGVVYAQFSPDGSRVITASLDKTAKIWDAVTGALLADLKGHTDVINYSAFSPDGKKILTVSGALTRRSEDTVVKIWDAVNGKFLVNLPHSTYIVSAQFSPDGKRIVTVARDKNAYVWDALNYKKLFSLTGHKDIVNSAKYSADGKKIITGSSDNTAIIWDANSGRFIVDLKGRSHQQVNNAFFSPDGTKIVTIHRNNFARIWDGVTYAVLNPLIGVNAAEFSPDSKLIVSSSIVNIGIVWDAVTGKALKNLTHDNPVVSVRFSPDGEKIVTASYDGTAKIWDTRNLKDTAALIADTILEGHNDWVLYAQFSKDNNKIVTASTDGTAMVWNANNGSRLVELKGHTEIISSAQISPDSKQILTASYDGSVKIWDAAKGSLILNIPSKAGLLSAEYNTDGTKIITAAADSVARIWDAETGMLLKELKGHEHWVLSAQFTRDGKRIATSSKDNTSLIWDANSDTIIFQLKYHKQQVNSVQFSRDGKRIVTASNDKTAAIWNAETGSLIDTLKGHNYFVTSAEFSPNGKRIVTASWDKTIRIWDAETGDSIFSIKKHTGWIHSARYSNDGQKIISASEDGTVNVFDANSFALIKEIPVDPYGVNAARFSPDGSKMIMATWGNTCKLWDVETNKMLFTFFPVDSIDYLVADSSYRYDGTQAARNLLYFTCGTEVIQLSQVKDQLWVPGLAEMILKGEAVNSKTLYQLGLCGYTPLTKDTLTAAGDYRFKITPRGGKLGETVVSVNGIETKKYQPKEIKNQKGEYEVVVKKKDLDSFLIPGKQNTLSVKAYTEDNKITSRGGEVIVNSEEIGPVVMPNLYAIIIGVSDYKGDSLDLKYAGKDANDISTVILKTASKYLNTDGKEHVFIYNLTTEPGNKRIPEKKIIKATFDSVGKKASTNDIFMLFFAGHGLMAGPANKKQFFILTKEAVSFKSSSGFKNDGISTSELLEWMKPQKIKAQKRALIFDACNSGQAIIDFRSNAMATQAFMGVGGNDKSQQIKSVDKLNEKSGFFILSASAPDQSAYEVTKLSQGLLTYALLNAVKTNNNILDNDSLLSIGKWFEASGETVTKLIKENGAIQDPQIIRNNNFSIGIVDNEVIATVNLPEDKPLFAGANLQNKNDNFGNDDLELSELVNKQFRTIASRGGSENKIKFMPVTNSPDAYKLNGNYVETNNIITVYLTVKNNKGNKQLQVAGTKDNLRKLAEDIVTAASNWALTNN